MSTTEFDLLQGSSTIESTTENELLQDTFHDILDYRGIHVDFYADSEFLQIIAVFNDQKLPLGYGNYDYKAEIRKVIDLQLDTISEFREITPGARLLYFDNYTNKDIKLVYKGRILKIYLIFDENNLNLAEIIQDSENCLKKVLKLEKLQKDEIK